MHTKIHAFKNHFHQESRAYSELWTRGEALNIPLRVKMKSNQFRIRSIYLRMKHSADGFFFSMSCQLKTKQTGTDQIISFPFMVQFPHLSGSAMLAWWIVVWSKQDILWPQQVVRHVCVTDSTCVFTGQDHSSTGRRIWSEWHQLSGNNWKIQSSEIACLCRSRPQIQVHASPAAWNHSQFISPQRSQQLFHRRLFLAGGSSASKEPVFSSANQRVNYVHE